jgi:2-oxoglutarate dehydrogenase E1 component
MEVLDDPLADPNKIKRVVFCSGKVYYDILEEKEKMNKADTAIIRLEQLYPFPYQQLNKIITKYSATELWEWVQEEPANMGALKFIVNTFRDVTLIFTSRPISGSPATGSAKLHKIQQQLIVEKALGFCKCNETNGSCRLHCAETEKQVG